MCFFEWMCFTEVGNQKDFRGNGGSTDKVLKGECNWLSVRWARILRNSAATHKISKGRISDWMPVGADGSYKEMVVV